MDIRQIRYFVAVYEEGSFSRAAVREHCTQPGISIQIQKLEAEVEHKLFERQARGVVPTVAGRHLYGCCTGLLDGLREARQRMLDLSDNVGGPLAIGVPPTLCLSALPRVLPTFLAENPYVDVRIAEAFSGTLTGWVVDGDLDVAIVTEPPHHLGLTTTPFFRDELVLVMRPGHTSRAPGPLGWSDLRGMQLILPSAKHGLRKTIAQKVGLGGSTSRTIEMDGMLATLELVRNSDWVTVLPICAVHEKIEQGELEAQRFRDGIMLDFYLVQTRDEILSVAAQRLLAGLRHAAEESTTRWRSSNTLNAGHGSRRKSRGRAGSKDRKEHKR